ncbi:TetR/AcrR family transcriptional regulator [Mucilaginibacter paludis]|uniref:Transcriptional regulator, TetR family n=1 Tax=Mucilaginibacter paludis DSM 18603 TaxID=714943 RepID=H1Y419_9SPHI|nr:TetR/AcrR family transcriptional regulator [Mucilaginibacter paludis]EHQ24755.1 transcriptional regulator, TetR family [Mucilaginibacter paludis DSM 18603]
MKNKEETKRRFINAVGEILKNEGYSALGVNNIARKAGVNKGLLYRYFGKLEYLIEAYVVENDYWMTFSNKLNEFISNNKSLSSQHLVTQILQNQYKFFLSEPEMQRLIHWELSGDCRLMTSIHNARESNGQKLLEMTDKDFENTKVNFRAIAALLVGGIYYTILHTRFNGGMFCDIDLMSANGQNEILKSIEQIVGWAFEKSKTK